MDEASYLRRQAALCLNLSRSCSDAELAEHLELTRLIHLRFVERLASVA
jgi:hypothetical protein